MEAAASISTITEEKVGRDSRLGSLASACWCVLLSVAVVVPFYFMGRFQDEAGRPLLRMPETHDMFLHYDQMKSFYAGLASGELYPRWEEDTNRGFGAPTTSYYPPGIYYLTSLMFLVIRDWLGTLLAVHLVMMITSAAGLYLYLRRHVSIMAAAVGMSAYVILPYHLVDQYSRGAMAELLGFVWMPLVLLFAERLFERPAERRQMLGNIAGLGAAYGAFLWSHPPTAYQFSLVFALFALLLAVTRKNWKGLLRVGLGIALGLASSAAYLYPALVERNLIRHEYIEDNWPYHESYVFAKTAYALAHRGFFNLIDATWIFCSAVILICGLLVVFSRTRLRLPTMLWMLVGLTACFMMTSASEPIGKMIPMINIGVFSWRMLSTITLAVALTVGSCAQKAIEIARERGLGAAAIHGGTAAFVVVAAGIFSTVAVIAPVIKAKAFEPEREHLNFATIPRVGPITPEELPNVERAELVSRAGRLQIEYWKPEHRAIDVEAADSDTLSIRTFNFPGWIALIDGQPARIETGEPYGQIMLVLPAGSHRVTLDYLETPPRKLGSIVTLSALAILVTLVVLRPMMRSPAVQITEE